MLEKLKSYAAAIAAVVIAVLSALLFRQKRQTRSLESALITEKADNVIKENERDRQIARDNADQLVAEYERLKRDD